MAKKKNASSKEAAPGIPMAAEPETNERYTPQSEPPPRGGEAGVAPVKRENWPPYIDGPLGVKTFTDHDGFEVKPQLLHLMLDEALTERDIALTVKEPGIVAGLNFKFAAEEWGRARDACLKIALDECDSQSTAENGQAWANCARRIADLIMELPERKGKA